MAGLILEEIIQEVEDKDESMGFELDTINFAVESLYRAILEAMKIFKDYSLSEDVINDF